MDFLKNKTIKIDNVNNMDWIYRNINVSRKNKTTSCKICGEFWKAIVPVRYSKKVFIHLKEKHRLKGKLIRTYETKGSK